MKRLSLIAGACALAVALVAAPAPSFAAVFLNVSVNFGPPALPVYVQPAAPAPDLIWAPGYWAYGPYGYYWVPGTWVEAPQPGYYWTPGYWGYAEDAYVWHPGYWGPQVGYYGGINYGNGYFGNGYSGGGWYGPHFRYNTAYTNVNQTYIRNVYVSRTVINNYYGPRYVSYYGGRSGTRFGPSAEQIEYGRHHHYGWTHEQEENEHIAATNRNYLAKINGGRPRYVAFASPLARWHRPPNFAPLNVHRSYAHVPALHAYHAHHAPAYHAYHTPAYHAYHTPAHHAYHAPAYHAYRTPAYHAYRAPAYHAPAYHAPAYHAYHAPVYHASNAPAYHAYHAPAHAGGSGRHQTGSGQAKHHG